MRRLSLLLKRTVFYEYVQYLVAGRNFVILTTLIFTLSALIYLLMQREEYLSESEFIPPNLQKLPVQAGASVIPGNAEDIAQVIAYLYSDRVINKIVHSFRLADRYDIKSDSPRARAKKIQALVDRNISISRTKAQTIHIATYDINPDTAYLINQFLINEAEDFCKRIAKYRESYESSMASLDSLKLEMSLLEEKLSDFRYKYKVFTLSDAQEAPTQTAIQLMLRNPDALRQYDKVVSMETRLRRFQELYARLYENLDGARRLLETYPNLLIMVNPPYKPEFSERPKIFRNTVIAGVIGFLLSGFIVVYLGMLGFYEEAVEEAEERELIAEKA